MAESFISSNGVDIPISRDSDVRPRISSSTKRDDSAAPATLDAPFSFRYRPLDEESQEIRVLVLQDGSGESPICLTLEYTPVTTAAGSFVAFSYCWGPEDCFKDVIVDGCSVSIRHNLWLFLHNYRQNAEDKGQRLWIDCLCIDQSNARERGHQVRFMSEIFSNANIVYAWLGEATPETDKAIEYIEYASTQPESRDGFSEIPYGLRDQRNRDLRTLINREYWARLWIIQELLLSRKTCLVTGAKFIPWEKFKDAVTDTTVPAKHLPKSYSSRIAPRQNFRHIWELKRTAAQASREDLHHLLAKFHRARCQDPRDKIYGLLGLTTASVREQVVVDYTCPVIETCLSNMTVIWNRDPETEPLTAEEVWTVIDWVLPNDNTLFNATKLSSQITSPVVSKTQMVVQAMILSTMGVYDSASSVHSEVLTKNPSAPHQRFVTDAHGLAHHWMSTDPPLMRIYSVTHCREWDFVLLLDKVFSFEQGNPVLLCRKVADSYQVVEIGLATIDFGQPPPEPILAMKLPKWHLRGHPATGSSLGCSILGLPTYKMRWRSKQHFWKVKFESTAAAELISTIALIRHTSDRVCAVLKTRHDQKSTDPKLLFPFLFNGDEKAVKLVRERRDRRVEDIWGLRGDYEPNGMDLDSPSMSSGEEHRL